MIKKFSHITIFDILYLTSSHWYLVFTIPIFVDPAESCDFIFSADTLCVDICKRMISPGVLSANEND